MPNPHFDQVLEPNSPGAQVLKKRDQAEVLELDLQGGTCKKDCKLRTQNLINYGKGKVGCRCQGSCYQTTQDDFYHQKSCEN
jgi:hypothetical protein